MTSSFGYDLECSDAVCCNDAMSVPENLTISVRHHALFYSYYYRYLFSNWFSTTVERLLQQAVKINGTDYAYSKIFTGGKTYQLYGISGLINSDKCMWNVYLDDTLLANPVLNCKVSVGQTTSFRYEERNSTLSTA